MNHFPVLLLRNLQAPCASQARACVLCAKLLQCCRPREHDLRTTPAQCNAKQALSSNFTPHLFTLHTCASSQLISSGSSHLIPCLAQTHSSTTLYYKACTKYFPVLLCTTKLAQSTSQYWCLLQKLAENYFQYHFVLQACTKYFLPVLLCTTKLAHTRYTLDRRPWHEMGFSGKTQCFLTFLIFALFQTTAKQHFIAFFLHCFKSCFSSSKKAMGVIGPRLV